MNTHIVRQVVLDTETTGMNKFGLHYEDHKIIEIGAIEIVNRRLTNKQFHTYLNPNRSVDPEAFKVHGINDQYLLNKPIFSDIANEFLEFITGSELIMHNASFDLGFLNYELKSSKFDFKSIESYCTIVDSLKIARQLFPGQRNSLDALCERYSINNSKRILHNALIDAQILAHIFLLMTGGQIPINFVEESYTHLSKNSIQEISQFKCNTEQSMNINKQEPLKVIFASQMERLEHEKCLDLIELRSKQNCLWRTLM